MARAIVLALFFVAVGWAGAAHGDDKQGMIVYDVTEGGGQALLDRLDSIEETRQDLVKQGITPRFVLSFRGPSTKLVQTDQEKIKPEDRAVAAKIAERIAELSKAPGVEALEQCAVAIRHQGTKAEKVLPNIKVVANSFVTIAAWQAKGFAYIRP
jgi:intracellular sulfur oxidation DsrE/DsrF family protein